MTLGLRRGLPCAIVVLILVSHWPLLIHGHDHVFGRYTDDAFEVLWQLERASRVVFDGEGSPFFTPNVYWPRGWHLASGAQPAWWCLALAPLTRLAGPVLAHNLACLAALAIAGLGAFRLTAAVTGRSASACVAALAYSMSPILTIRLGGHLDVLIGATALPYAALAAWRATSGDAGRGRRQSLLAGLFIGLSCLGHWQFVFIAPILPLAVLLFGARSRDFRRGLVHVLWMALAAGAVVAPFARIALHARANTYSDPFVFDFESADRFSMSPDRLLVPNPLHPLWGEASRRAFLVEGEEGVVSLGWVMTGLAVVGFALRWSGRGALVAGFSMATVFSLGTSLHWGGAPVVFGSSSVLPLPATLVRNVVPFFDDVRTWNRFMIAGTLALAVIAGVAASRLRASVVAIALLLIAFESLSAPYPYFTRVEVNHREVDDWLRSAPRGAVIEYPLPETNLLAMYAQGRHRQPVVNGMMSIHPTWFREALPRLGRWPNDAALDLLAERGVRYLLLNAPSSGEVERDVVPRLERTGRVERLGVFEGSFGGAGRVFVFAIRR
jgi:hypothetical protein